MSSWSLRTSERRDSISAVVDAQGLLPTAEITGTETSITRSTVSASSSMVVVGLKDANTMRTFAGSHCRNSSRSRGSPMSSFQS